MNMENQLERFSRNVGTEEGELAYAKQKLAAYEEAAGDDKVLKRVLVELGQLRHLEEPKLPSPICDMCENAGTGDPDAAEHCDEKVKKLCKKLLDITAGTRKLETVSEQLMTDRSGFKYLSYAPKQDDLKAAAAERKAKINAALEQSEAPPPDTPLQSRTEALAAAKKLVTEQDTKNAADASGDAANADAGMAAAAADPEAASGAQAEGGDANAPPDPNAAAAAEAAADQAVADAENAQPTP
jgi:hypothetical protein